MLLHDSPFQGQKLAFSIAWPDLTLLIYRADRIDASQDGGIFNYPKVIFACAIATALVPVKKRLKRGFAAS
jgi:hypothetical protein